MKNENVNENEIDTEDDLNARESEELINDENQSDDEEQSEDKASIEVEQSGKNNQKDDDDDDELPVPDSDNDKDDDDDDEEKYTKKDVEKIVRSRLSRKANEFEQQRRQISELSQRIEQIQSGSGSNQQGNQQFLNETQTQISRDMFDDESDYIDALVQQRLSVNIKRSLQAKEEQARQAERQELVSKLSKATDTGARRYSDYDDVVSPLFSEGFPSNPSMCEAILNTDFAPDILYYMGKYPDKAREMATKKPALAIKEVYKLEERFNARNKKLKAKTFQPASKLKSQGINNVSLSSLNKHASSMSIKDFDAQWEKLKKSNK